MISNDQLMPFSAHFAHYFAPPYLRLSAGAMTCMCRWETVCSGQWNPVITLPVSPPCSPSTRSPASSISCTMGMSSLPRHWTSLMQA